MDWITYFPEAEPEKTELRTLQGRLCECVRTETGYEIRRIFSTDPSDYLDPRFFPGTAVPGPFDGEKHC